MDPALLEQAKARYRKLALAKLAMLVPGRDATAKEDKRAVMQECFGVDGQKAFEALGLPELRAGWLQIQAFTKEEPPAPEPAPADAFEADGEDGVSPEDSEAEEAMDDASVTAWLLEHLREQAKAIGQERAFADFLEDHTQDGDYDADGQLVLDEDARNEFLGRLLEELPALAATLPTE